MTIEEEPEDMPFDPPLLASLQEGEEWIARLESEQAYLEMDMLAANNVLSSVGLAAIAFTLSKTKEAIEQIKLEMMMLDE